MPRHDAAVASVMAPKGLAAAVLAGVPLQLGIAGGEAVQQFVYMVVLVSIIVTSVAIPLLGVPPLAWLMARVLPAGAVMTPLPVASPGRCRRASRRRHALGTMWTRDAGRVGRRCRGAVNVA